MKSAPALAAALLFASLGFIGGCARPEAEVSGTVLMDDAPLKEGEIIFEEVDKKVAANAGKIVDSRYRLKVLPGHKIVRVRASRPAGKPDPLMGQAPREAMIAEEFNAQSTLSAAIKPGKNDGLDFKVKSIPQN